MTVYKTRRTYKSQKPNVVPQEGMKQTDGCGLFGIYPKWLRPYSTSKIFFLVYGLLGMVQAMSFIYIIVILTTLEKRFRIPSRTTGLILSGNEISQILSLGLIYYGGAGHRPRWLAAGIGLSAISCFVLALPHLIYGPGRHALSLTLEYLNSSVVNSTSNDISLCSKKSLRDKCDDENLEDSVLLPCLLIFSSQFILGVGTTFYYGLGQTYLDDNIKKKDTPMLLGCTYALRTVGPVFGFLLGFACLNLYIDPSLHPIIDKKDPRWLGAWWLGWLILGGLMIVFTCLIAMFPRELTKPSSAGADKEWGEELFKREINVRSSITEERSNDVPKPISLGDEKVFKPSIRDLPVTMRRVFSNKILMANSGSAVCVILGMVPYVTFLPKYLEVQFGVSSAGGSVVTATVSLIGMVISCLISGFAISKFKPSAPKLLGWNVFVAVTYFAIVISFVHVGCEDQKMQGLDVGKMSIDFTTRCNSDCNCDGVEYAPVCHEPSMTTFFSACHAGCNEILGEKNFGNCSCVIDLPRAVKSANIEDFGKANEKTKFFRKIDSVKGGPCPSNCSRAYFTYAALCTVMYVLASSGRIGNVLVSYRCVDKKDKSLAQGVTLMMISLFGLIPGPIVFGALIDSTCIIWEDSCGSRGNCWYYDKERFRHIVNYVAAGFVFVGAIFDSLVCYLVRNLDLYGLNDDKRREFVKDVIEPSEGSEIGATATTSIADQPSVTEDNHFTR